MDTAFAIKFFGTFFAIMNPFLTLPFFMSMTADNTSKEQRYMACYIAFYSFIICIASAIIGTQILSFFEIKIAHFRVAGGLVLLGIAFSMVNGSKTEGQDEDSKKQPTVKRLSRDDIFYPMIFPMTIGPATISTLIVYSHQATNVEQYIAYGAVLIVMHCILFIALFFSSYCRKIFTATAKNILTHIMGILLVAISVEMIIGGLIILLPVLAS